jgi:hypothetical protein
VSIDHEENVDPEITQQIIITHHIIGSADWPLLPLIETADDGTFIICTLYIITSLFRKRIRGFCGFWMIWWIQNQSTTEEYRVRLVKKRTVISLYQPLIS